MIVIMEAEGVSQFIGCISMLFTKMLVVTLSLSLPLSHIHCPTYSNHVFQLLTRQLVRSNQPQEYQSQQYHERMRTHHVVLHQCWRQYGGSEVVR